MLKNTKIIIEKIKLAKDPRILGLITFGILALLVTWSGIKVVQTNFELDKKIAVSKQRNEVARLQNENLKLKNTYFESDQYLELAARKQFGKAAVGEKLYVIPESVAMARTVENPQLQPVSEPEIQQQKNRFSQNLESWQEFLFR